MKTRINVGKNTSEPGKKISSNPLKYFTEQLTDMFGKQPFKNN
jgi:hypothetical protein